MPFFHTVGCCPYMRVFFKLLAIFALTVALFTTLYEKSRPKIYDCILFFNDAELLEIRLSELYDHVDKFVVVETIENFQGKLKPLYFEENRHLFKKFEDKIIHIALKERVNTSDPWERKAFQRNQIMRGLIGCADHDIILLSDMDEIVKASKLKEIITPLLKGKEEVVGTKQRQYTYYLNRFEKMEPGTVATTYGYLRNHTPQQLRRRKNRGFLVEDAGWHFKHIGGLQRVLTKIAASTYANAIEMEKADPEYLTQEMENGSIEEIDFTFPKCIQENEERFREIGLIR